MNKTFVVLLTAILLSPLFVTPVKADWLIDRSGALIQLDPLVLGDSDEQKSEVKTEEKNEERKQDEVKSDQPENRSSENKSSEAEKKATEQRQEVEKKNLEKARERAKEKLESTIKINEIKATKNKLERESEVEVEGNKLKIKQKTRDANGKETETQLELGDGEELQVESRNSDEKEKIHLNPGKDDSVEIEHGNTRISTKLPITLNANNELVVTRKDGTQKVVAVMPDQALAKLREQNIIATDNPAELPELEDEDGQSVYRIDGSKEEKVLGLFKVSYKTRAVVSAETGEVVRTETSGFDRFLSLFSF